MTHLTTQLTIAPRSRDSLFTLHLQIATHKGDSSDIDCLYRPVSVATSHVLTPTYTQTQLHIGRPSILKTHSLARAQGAGRQPPSTSPRTIWNTCSNYAAEKTRYRRPDFHQGTLTTDKFPFCLAPHSALYLFLYVLQLTTVNHSKDCY